jgi:hypothetical protein
MRSLGADLIDHLAGVEKADRLAEFKTAGMEWEGFKGADRGGGVDKRCEAEEDGNAAESDRWF